MCVCLPGRLLFFWTKEQAAKFEHCLSQHLSEQTHTHTHLRGLKWRGSERSRAGRGSKVRPETESSSDEPEGFRERPDRVEDEEAHGAEGVSMERLSGGLYGAMASFRQCGPGLVEREEWALEDLLWPP